MPTAFAVYLCAWVVACTAAGVIACRRRRQIELFGPRYWRFLLRPWRTLTFAIAAGALVVVAPHTGDPTWDYADAAFMSVLAYATAPWALGTLYRSARALSGIAPAYVAACVWMFSASWSYDLYILLRDGNYPGTWLANIAASSVLYASAGLFWNLDHRPGRGVTFAFLEQDWLAPGGSGVSRVLAYGLPFMGLVAATLVYFVLTA